MVPFKKVSIIGLGLIGGSLGLAIKRKIPHVEILGSDEKNILDEALAIGAVDFAYPKSEICDCVRKSDLVFLAMPIHTIIGMLPQIAEWVVPDTLVTDVGSTKTRICEEASKHFTNDRYFIGGHPMAGSEGHGISWADALLFENAVYVLTPGSDTPVAKAQQFGNLLERIGAKVLFLSPFLHDQIAAAVSHLPQMVAVALVNLVAKHQNNSPMFLKLAAGGFRDMTRIASSPYYIWKDIVQTNQEEILRFIDELIHELEDMRPAIQQIEMEKIFQNAAKHRLSIPKDTKGFFKPHFDMLVRVEDKPGVIATISASLAAEHINIKDIEILKVREGDVGTLRISLETTEDREKAILALQKIGFSSKAT